ncbi:hypothetical protein JYU34_011752 [Plutella xylostella]|uniref:Uncharacterized protein n=1 Tax=Plutella xylostella TaxID=51655 RepID=A0ABQ7QDN5_PLUXY|nr:hypothetical protein JYU34_011752 [Plutella xylostella]
MMPRTSSSSSTNLASTVERNQSLQAKQYKGLERPEFKENDLVWTMKHSSNQKFCWVEGIVRKKVGSVMYVIYIPEINCEVKKHIDQIRPRSAKPTAPEQHEWEPDVVPDVGEDDDAAAPRPGPSAARGPQPQGEEKSAGSTGTGASPPDTPAVPRARRREISPAFSSGSTSSDTSQRDEQDEPTQQSFNILNRFF